LTLCVWQPAVTNFVPIDIGGLIHSLHNNCTQAAAAMLQLFVAAGSGWQQQMAWAPLSGLL